jgi:hypothetical protein
MSYRDDHEQWLRYLSAVGQYPEPARTVALEHPGVACHRDQYGGHYWIQVFNDDGSVWLLHGKDSILPGLDIPKGKPSELELCDCGRWVPASKETAQQTRRFVQQVQSSRQN